MKVKSRMATLDDIHDLVRLNVLFNGVQVRSDYLSTQLVSPYRVETSIVAEVDNRLSDLLIGAWHHIYFMKHLMQNSVSYLSKSLTVVAALNVY